MDTNLTFIQSPPVNLVIPTSISDILRIENNGNQVSLEAFNMLGQPIMHLTLQRGINQASTTSWPNGLYILVAKDNSGKSLSYKLIKQR
ncbi:MAG: hypothetical protein ACI9FU_001759 [Granulosicoccus sp.]